MLVEPAGELVMSLCRQAAQLGPLALSEREPLPAATGPMMFLFRSNQVNLIQWEMY
jgi:hypothetical protein